MVYTIEVGVRGKQMTLLYKSLNIFYSKVHSCHWIVNNSLVHVTDIIDGVCMRLFD